MAHDDETCGSVGVVARLQSTDEGKTRLIFHDVRSDATSPPNWATQALFTWRDFETAELCGLRLTEKDYALIGENLLIRLLALEGKLA